MTEYTPIERCPKCKQKWDEEKAVSANKQGIRFTYACKGCNVQAVATVIGYP